MCAYFLSLLLSSPPTTALFTERLYLEQNMLSGNLPDSFFSLQNLQRLRLFQNNLAGPLSARLAELTELQILEIGGNGWTNTIPEAIYTLRDIVILKIANSNITGTLSASVTALGSTAKHLVAPEVSGQVLGFEDRIGHACCAATGPLD